MTRMTFREYVKNLPRTEWESVVGGYACVRCQRSDGGPMVPWGEGPRGQVFIHIEQCNIDENKEKKSA